MGHVAPARVVTCDEFVTLKDQVQPLNNLVRTERGERSVSGQLVHIKAVKGVLSYYVTLKNGNAM